MDVPLKQIGKYKILEELGRGGMAVVYHAVNNDTNQQVALKVLPPTLATHANTLQRFTREGENTSRLNHENIVKVYESSSADGYNYIAMQLVRGKPLDEQIVDNGKLFSIDEAVAILSELAAGLDYAHSQGIIHRDIKPANVLISNEGRVMLADFGIARHLLLDQTMYTVAGQSVGTPAYMSPEQARGQETIDYRSDVYSFGILAYKLFTGRIPFHSQDQLQMMRKVVMEDPTPMYKVNPELPMHLSNVVQKCLSKDPQDRYESAGAFMGALMRGYTPSGDVALGGSSDEKNSKNKDKPEGGLTWYDRTIGKLKTSANAPKVSSFEFKRTTVIQQPSVRPLSGRHLIQTDRRAKQITLTALTIGVFATALFFGNAWIDKQKALNHLNTVTAQIEERIFSGDLITESIDLPRSGIDTIQEKSKSFVENSSELGTSTMNAVNRKADTIATTIEQQSTNIDLPNEEIGTVVNTVWYPKHTIEKMRTFLEEKFDATSEWISNAIASE